MRKKSIEELMADQIFSLITRIIALKTSPDIAVNTINELTEEQIDKLKIEKGIEGILLDLDETLRKEMQEIPTCNQEWLDMIKTKFKVIIVSNGSDKKMQEFFKLKGIDYIGIARKPFKKNFRKACQMMNLEPEKVMVIGDDLFSDIYGGKRMGMSTIQVKNVLDTERM